MPRTKREEKNTPKSIQVCELARKKMNSFTSELLKMIWCGLKLYGPHFPPLLNYTSHSEFSMTPLKKY